MKCDRSLEGNVRTREVAVMPGLVSPCRPRGWLRAEETRAFFFHAWQTRQAIARRSRRTYSPSGADAFIAHDTHTAPTDHRRIRRARDIRPIPSPFAGENSALPFRGRRGRTACGRHISRVSATYSFRHSLACTMDTPYTQITDGPAVLAIYGRYGAPIATCVLSTLRCAARARSGRLVWARRAPRRCRTRPWGAS